MASESSSRAAKEAAKDREGRTTSALKRQLERIEDDAEERWSRTRDVFSDVTQTLDIKGRLERHPYGTLAAAVGLGYVLGGGFFTPLTGRLFRLGLKIGLRLAVVPLLNEETAALVGDFIGGETSSARGAGRTRRRGQANDESGSQAGSDDGKGSR